MKKLNLSHVNYRQATDNIYYLPYSTGILWSYARMDPDVSNNWMLGELQFSRDNIDDVYKRLADCDVLGLSTYIWNKNYNYLLGKRIKEYNPNVKIILGGPEVAVTDSDFFLKNPWADAIVKKEGEIVFTNLLKTGNYENVKGLLVNIDGKTFDTGDADRIKNIDQIPSPYTTGIFDKIIKDNPNVTWNTILETNRGCPYQCTFCDWGSLTYSKVTKFNLERIYDELEWMSSHKIDYVMVTDANFGMFIERDNLITDKIIDLQKNTGYPKRFNFSWAKNHKVEIIKLVKKLYSSGINSGLVISTQSMTFDVLKNIKRQNLEMTRLNETFKLCNAESIPITTELILPLPGETLETWKSTLYSMIDIGLHGNFETYIAQLLENAELNLKQKKEFEIKSKHVSDYIQNSRQDQNIKENMEIVIGTKDMPTSDLIDALSYTSFILTMHSYGFSQYFSRILNKKHGIPYKDFYESLYEYMKNEEWFKQELTILQNTITTFLCSDDPLPKLLGRIQVDGNNILYFLIFRIYIHNLLEKYFNAVVEFIKINYNNTLSKLLIDDILSVTKNFVIDFNAINTYPKQYNFSHNLIGYLINDENLDTKVKLEFALDKEVKESNADNLADFLLAIYYKRRRYFGRTQIRSIQ